MAIAVIACLANRGLRREGGGVNRLLVDIPDVFRWSRGDSVGEQPEDGWRGIVALHYGEGWIDVDTFYRWTRAERVAIAGILRRLLYWLVRVAA